MSDSTVRDALQEYPDLIPLSQVDINREGRQRKELTRIPELAASIERTGLLNPIIIRREGNRLVAGERRFTAYTLLHSQWCIANQKPLDSEGPWRAVPFRYLDTLDPIHFQIVELEENAQREDMPWQDQVDAIKRIHELKCTLNPNQTHKITGESIGLSASTISRYLQIHAEITKGNQQVIEAKTLSEAMTRSKLAMARMTNELIHNIQISTPTAVVLKPAIPTLASLEIDLGPKPVQAPVIHSQPQPAPALIARTAPVIQADFNEWASTYSGVPFNFLHCDFPYGINHGESSMGKSQDYGTYSDSADTYWKLLETLATHRERFLTPSAHIIFWFSMKHYVKTLEFFNTRLPDFVVDDYPLIWTKKNSMAPDITRRPQRNYETALFAFSRGRKIAKLCSNVANVSGGDKLHLSTKPVAMLRSFFRLTCDEHTRMLDPTCGSGNALIAAKAAGAPVVLGLEIMPEYVKVATDNYISAENIGFGASINYQGLNDE